MRLYDLIDYFWYKLYIWRVDRRCVHFISFFIVYRWVEVMQKWFRLAEDRNVCCLCMYVKIKMNLGLGTFVEMSYSRVLLKKKNSWKGLEKYENLISRRNRVMSRGQGLHNETEYDKSFLPLLFPATDS